MLLLEAYFQLACVLSVAACLGIVLSIATHRQILAFNCHSLMQIHKLLFVLALISFLGVFAWEKPGFERPKAQSFSSSSYDPTVATKVLQQKLKTVPKKINIAPNTVVIFQLLFFVLLLIAMLRYSWAISKLFYTVKKSTKIRTIGRLSYFLTEEKTVPYTFSWWHRSFVVIPQESLCTKNFKLAMMHELQHIRQGDTFWVHWQLLLQSLFFWNPIVLCWMQTISQDQEFSCDENLIAHKGVNRKKYAECLYEVACSAGESRILPIGATGFILRPSNSQLIRRIIAMKTNNTKQKSAAIFVCAIFTTSFIFAASAFALTKLSFSEKLSVAKVQSIVNIADFSRDFPITVNDAVVAQLNRLTQTERGRRFVRKAKQNYQIHESMLNAYVEKYRFPKELLAVAFIESAFQNLPQSSHPMQSAGMWQFIPTTARKFGLQVNERIDERQNIELATDAAMRYLGHNYLRFNDWELAVLSYNYGENGVQRGIDSIGSRNAWELIDAGFEGDRNYLAKVIAAVILMKYPAF